MVEFTFSVKFQSKACIEVGIDSPGINITPEMSKEQR